MFFDGRCLLACGCEAVWVEGEVMRPALAEVDWTGELLNYLGDIWPNFDSHSLAAADWRSYTSAGVVAEFTPQMTRMDADILDLKNGGSTNSYLFRSLFGKLNKVGPLVSINQHGGASSSHTTNERAMDRWILSP